MPVTEQDLDTAFATLERFAVGGERCPENGTHGIDSHLTTPLARAGRIRIHLYAHNWRVIEIVTGPHKGARTAPPANAKLKPWRTIGTEDTRRPATMRSRPSAPRALTAADLNKL